MSDFFNNGWSIWISAIALMLWLLMDVEKIRRGGGR